jgi:hypothetical protein
MGRRKAFLLLVTFALTFGAGIVLGWVWTPLQKAEASASGPRGGPRPWFEQLDLSADQKTQMDKTWGDTRQQMQKLSQQRWEMEKKREDAILGLLDPAQREKYNEIDKSFRAQREALDKQREALFADANARSRALLSPAQQQNWDILTKQFQTRHRHGPGPGSMGMGTQPSASTMPSN